MTKKKLCRILNFKDNDLRIAANKKVTDFLDITLDLQTGSYKLYKKPNDTISYIQCQSNHPPSIIKNLPKGIEIRLPTNSANGYIFQEAAKPYNNVLDTRRNLNAPTKKPPRTKEEKHLLTATQRNLSPSQIIQKKKKQQQKEKEEDHLVQPPTSKNVATNIVKKYFILLSACFPANNKLHKIINKNTIKLSYSCMSNIKQSIANHNKAILSKEKIKEEQIKL